MIFFRKYKDRNTRIRKIETTINIANIPPIADDSLRASSLNLSTELNELDHIELRS